MDHLISARRPDVMRVNNKREPAVSADYWEKLKENEKSDRYIDLARELTKLWNMKVTNCIWRSWFSHRMLGTGTGGHGNKRKSGDIQTTTLLGSIRILRRVLEI